MEASCAHNKKTAEVKSEEAIGFLFLFTVFLEYVTMHQLTNLRKAS